MTEQEVQEIYGRLLESTRDGKIRWEKTGEEEFTINFSRSSVSIEIENVLDGAQAVLKVYNDDGHVIAYAAPTVGVGMAPLSAKEFELDPSELFSLVQEKTYKYSETYENILNELRKLKAS
jgi:hypothetical protein